MIEIDIKKDLPNFKLDLAFEMQRGEFISIVGKSGAGKTTLLRVLAGLESAEGEIRFDNKIWLNGDRVLAPQKRGIGFMFQDYALFENMSVEQNLLYIKNDKKMANHLLDLTELTHLKKSYPRDLSGGEKQRVALCRALINRPKLLLLDEPLSSLDQDMRKKLQLEILKLKDEFDLSIIMVSHDLGEAYTMSDKIIHIDRGSIVAVDDTKDLFRDPKYIKAKIIKIKKLGDKVIATIDLLGEIIAVELDNSNLDDSIDLFK